jgi:hypothetical protein
MLNANDIICKLELNKRLKLGEKCKELPVLVFYNWLWKYLAKNCQYYQGVRDMFIMDSEVRHSVTGVYISEELCKHLETACLRWLVVKEQRPLRYAKEKMLPYLKLDSFPCTNEDLSGNMIIVTKRVFEFIKER